MGINRIRSYQMWQELTTLLNSLGGGVSKTSDKWKKVWIDWKTKTKKKALLIQQDMQGTGGGPGCRLSLSDFENRVLAAMGGATAVTGLSEVREIAFQRPRAASQHVDADSDVSMEDSLPLNYPSTSQLTEEHLQTPIVTRIPEPSTSFLPPPAVAVSPPADVPPATPTNVAAVSPPHTPLVADRQARRRPASQQGVGSVPRQNRRNLTPFERAVDVFGAVEERRLQIEADRNRRQHEIDLRCLELDERRLEMEARRDATLSNLAEAITNLSAIIAQRRLDS